MSDETNCDGVVNCCDKCGKHWWVCGGCQPQSSSTNSDVLIEPMWGFMSVIDPIYTTHEQKPVDLLANVVGPIETHAT